MNLVRLAPALLPLAASLAAGMAVADSGEHHRLRVVNRVSAPINQLFGIRSGGERGVRRLFPRRHAGDDRLGSAIIAAGGTTWIDFGADPGDCLFDLKAIDQEGRSYARAGFDVCRGGEWTIAAADRIE